MVQITTAIEVHNPEDFIAWLDEHHTEGGEVWTIIYTKASGKQTITLYELQVVAAIYGWVDVLGKKVDSERWALRFMPRRKGGNWTAKNREIARRLIAEGRMKPAGYAALPADFDYAEIPSHREG